MERGDVDGRRDSALRPPARRHSMRNYIQLLPDKPSWEFSEPWRNCDGCAGEDNGVATAGKVMCAENKEREKDITKRRQWFIAQGAAGQRLGCCRSPSDIRSEEVRPPGRGLSWMTARDIKSITIVFQRSDRYRDTTT